jgi:hypothetical protein
MLHFSYGFHFNSIKNKVKSIISKNGTESINTRWKIIFEEKVKYCRRRSFQKHFHESRTLKGKEKREQVHLFTLAKSNYPEYHHGYFWQNINKS